MYVIGYFNGGGLVNFIVCNVMVGVEFVVFVFVVGVFYENNEDEFDCKLVRNVVFMLEIYGGDDCIIFYDGGKGCGGELLFILDW